MSLATVEIAQIGRGGWIIYREDRIVIRFDWEFAGSERVLALVFGSPARVWDENHPAARGRQADIYDRVCAEIVRQKAPRSEYEIDLERGLVTVMEPEGTKSN